MTVPRAVTEPSQLTDAELDRFAELAVASHRVITTHQDAGGGYAACPSFSAYAGYAWLRDGAFTAEGISRYGDVASASLFHAWVAGVLRDRRGQVDVLLATARDGKQPPLEAMLPTRFTFGGQDGADPWWEFQTDGYGTWLWAVVTHADRHDLDLAQWLGGIEVAVDYLLEFWPLPCYDWWEEHLEQRHGSTLAAIFGGLTAVAGAACLDGPRRERAADAAGRIRLLVLDEGVAAGHLTKWLGTAEVDGSLPAAIVPFGLLDVADPIAAETIATVSRDLDVGGGVHRFRADEFYGGGQWLLLSALLGWNEAARGDLAAATEHLRWVASHATEADELPEQVTEHLLRPELREAWLDRWGDVATPLLWSHGMYLILADELGLIRKAVES